VTDPMRPSLVVLADFMNWLFRERKIQASSISNYRSAIAFFWKRNRDFDVPSDEPLLCDLMRSFRRQRPVAPRSIVTWDLTLVLRYFQTGVFTSWNTPSNKELTLKTVFLTALATGKRRSELHAFTRTGASSVHGSPKGMELRPDPTFISKTHIKTGGLGAMRSVFIPSMDDAVDVEESEKLLCPVRTLKFYMARSDMYRSPHQRKLFISWLVGKTQDITARTISAYIKLAITEAYKAASPELLADLKIKPHSVRHVATSLQALKLFSLADLLRAGSWTSPNVFISHYVQDFTVDSLTQLSHVGGFIAAGAQY